MSGWDKKDFRWNNDKLLLNLRKHGVHFNEAASVFLDPFAVFKEDGDHSDDENREWVIGYSEEKRLLIVVHVEYEGDIIRIFSARKVAGKERKLYEEHQ